LGLHWQFGVVQNSVSTVSAPSAMTINDDDGTAASMTIRMYDGGGRATGIASDIAHGDTSTFNNFNPSGAGVAAMAIYADSGSSGTAPTSFAWAISLPTNESSLTFTPSNANTVNITTENLATTAVMLNFGSGSITSGDEVVFQAICTGTNAGGSTASPTYQFTITFA
tara:strand:+ start:848 stop:1351 length:504 start_codon:yes stop_codon:yes gene_type:complete